ncbi:unnamed protein product [Cuscuta epithymum]|uniref:Glycosyltransferase n=1 Tax=Cuscuta epithymum TaxID=186058 RepID=A0AAV0CSE2_9ASTE|nr:unnamed protein product [Cuscuta epithymum]
MSTKMVHQRQPPPGHIVIATFPAQGHINPSLQFAERLIRMGIHVTLATTVFAHRLMIKANGAGVPHAAGFNIAAFSDGYDQGFKKNDDFNHYLSELRTHGSEALKDIVSACAADGFPVTAIVRTIMLPWVADVAREVNVPSALLWIQPAAVLGIYYYYFHGYEDAFGKEVVELPGLPPLSGGDLPSFLLPSGSGGIYGFALAAFKEDMEQLDDVDPNDATVLVNTFDALEAQTLKAAVNIRYNLLGIGPLIPQYKNDPSNTSFRGDLFKNVENDNIKNWLDSQPESSLVYISFGSFLNPCKSQKEEISKALLEIKRPFLWVIRHKLENEMEERTEDQEEEFSNREELEKQGKILGWCSQMEVLSHPSLGCFITHCGWNSTLESICSGVPVVAFPHWADQGTNAKLIQDVWKTGVRVAAKAKNDAGVEVVGSDEIKRCIEIVLGKGGEGDELRRNAKKWRDLAMEASKEGGSSGMNLKTFAAKVATQYYE